MSSELTRGDVSYLLNVANNVTEILGRVGDECEEMALIAYRLRELCRRRLYATAESNNFGVGPNTEHAGVKFQPRNL